LEAVQDIITSSFTLANTGEIPNPKEPAPEEYKALHYRVYLKQDGRQDPAFSNEMIEIQLLNLISYTYQSFSHPFYKMKEKDTETQNCLTILQGHLKSAQEVMDAYNQKHQSPSPSSPVQEFLNLHAEFMTAYNHSTHKWEDIGKTWCYQVIVLQRVVQSITQKDPSALSKHLNILALLAKYCKETKKKDYKEPAPITDTNFKKLADDLCVIDVALDKC